MVMSMDAINDQTMSSTFDDSATINSDSYKQPESADDDLNDDELSKGSSQTVVVKRHQQQSGKLHQRQQQPPSANENDDDDDEDDEKCHQPMIVSRGSSIDEDQKQTKMNLDEDSSSDEPLAPSLPPPPQGTVTRLVTETEESAKMRQPTPTVTTTSLRLTSVMDPKNRVDSLVAQMRDIVDGGQTSRMNPESKTPEHHGDNRPQPRSSSDSLNNQNENNTSKASIDGVGAQKRTRRTRGHCRHHHHHHHHHGGQQRHKQDSEKSSIVGVDNAGASGVGGGTCDAASQINHPHHHHHHHRHQTGSSTHRPHANSHSHPHHHHHHHGHHHHPHHHHHREHHQGERRGTMSKRSSIQRPSLALIDPTGGSLNLVPGTCQIGDDEEENLTNRDLNSSMSSTSSNPAVVIGQQASKQQSQQNINTNPNQSNPDSKSSVTPPDEKIFDEVGATTAMQQQQQQQQQQQRDIDKSQEFNQQQHSSHQQHQHHQHRHHHHHHHRCHHRSHKKRLIIDSNNEFKSTMKNDAQEGSSQILEGEDGSKREVLGDLKSSLNTSPGAAARPLDHENHCEIHSKGASHSHGHSHSHHHHHHPHSHHHIHCVASTNKLTDDSNNNNKSKSTDEQQADKAQHHHHHRHHKYHHHHHGHHCKQHRHKTRRKSDVQSNVELSSNRDQTNNKSTNTMSGGGGSGAKVDSSSNYCNVVSSKLAGSDDSTTNQLRTSTMSSNNKDIVGGKLNMDLEVSEDIQNINDKRETKEDDVVDMEMSPSNERRPSRVQQTCELPSSTKSATTHEAVISRNVRQEFGKEARRASQLNALNQQDNNQMQIQSAKDGDNNNSNQCSIEPNQKSTQDESSAYKFNGSYESNQENCYKGSNVGDVSGRESKLVRQMSSHSSKKSQKDDVAREGESQSQQLADYAPRLLQLNSFQPSIQPRQIIETSVSADRRCRLCWCCCCPCSALSAREVANRTDTVKTDTDPSNSPTDKLPPVPNVPLEEVRSWGESFDKLMRCQAGRKVFQDFLRCEYSEENILFWTACEDLKKERDSKSIASKARDIYEDYISILSSKEVSLDSRVRDVINNNIKKPTSNIFDEAQLQIYTLMHRDSYPRFINSNMYKKLAQLSASNSSRKSSS